MREPERELEEHHCKIQAFAIVNITEAIFPALFCLIWMFVCVPYIL